MTNNLSRILRSRAFVIPTLLMLVVFGYIEYTFSDFALTLGNLGSFAYYYEIFLSVLTLIFAPIFFGLSTYKIIHFTRFEKKD